MKSIPKCYGIIPARYKSSRFPGKPLAEILGKPMFWHVYDRARQCRELSEVVLATDDERIEAAAKALNVPVVMTRDDHPSGTDRVLEAARILQVPEGAVVVNIQGDEPTLEPDMLTTLVQPFVSPQIQVTTLAKRIDRSESESPDRVNAVFSRSGKGLYFSRSLVPYSGEGETTGYYEHVGLYAFRLEILERFVELGPSPLEIAEKLEMLRLIENDIPIQVEIIEHESVCVERPEDIDVAERILMEKRRRIEELQI
ncbi:MAG: 3-deoxy-D-manno-octulosonate cytidylyltransferase [Desulfobacterales bacterium S5133MH4]|nr:MAG: 3-deoxy-D-manno-octulosonate cytidylyltransferase [Desulfobacterales bacterium S5133MH4]